MLRQARSSRQVTGRRELHDLGSRACSALSDRPTWRTVMNRMFGDYADALGRQQGRDRTVATNKLLSKDLHLAAQHRPPNGWTLR
ncbi:hypothetical protein SBD_2053 [Streptomyces bottropensis ATCC 25435]|uniref:Uncharacterized protein n=1 Tax=Streptomyces bottropensis ATCC 25435 TaxID=1054862 RepID=M3DI83_9ACTN|nr:hypothetical protein SBD_2053 [Streptomyces bottropensis ATCC 25435]